MDRSIEIDFEQMIADFAEPEIPDEADGWYTITRIAEIVGQDRKTIEYMIKKHVESGLYEAHPDNPVKNANYYRRVG